MSRPLNRSRRLGRRLLAGAVGLTVLLTAVPAWAQSPAVRYQRAMAREKTARASASSAAALRAIAKSYEAIVRAYPRSGYCDNALWQAAGLLQLAHERSRSATDLQAARHMLTWLRREYPTSSLAKQVPAKLASLRPAPAAPAPQPRAAAADAAEPVAADNTAAPAPAPAVPAPTPAPAVAPAAAAAVPGNGEIARAAFLDAGPKRVDALPALAVPPPPPEPPDAPNTVREISRASLPKGDRIVIELGRETTYTTRRQSRPDRVQIEIAEAGPAADLADRVSSIGGGLVKSVAVGKGSGRGTRVVLELTGEPRFSTFPLYSPFRLVVDVESDAVVAEADDAAAADRTARAAATPATPPPPPPSPPATPSSTGRGDYSLARQLGLGVSRVVIDPGHGGHDPGARAHGVAEAEIVLDVALRVEKLLRAQPGFDVVLTRRTDEFIPLEARTALANRESADMFLSIHANASPRSATRGVETYLLDFATNPDAEALAARENASSAQTMRLLPDLVKAIALNNKVDESRELARMVQASLVRRLAPLSKGLQDLGVKRAPFVVLIGAEMPSVLAEISFLTNRTDASLLKQASHRQRIAEALADGVLRYRASLKNAPPAAAQTATRERP